MRKMMAWITALVLLCSGCGGKAEQLNVPVFGADLEAAGDWNCWEGEALELQRRLVRWYGINLASDRPEPGFREGYGNILAGPGGMIGLIHFPDMEITMPIFHDGWEGAGFVHDAASPFPAGEDGTAVLTLAKNQWDFLKAWLSLENDWVFQILILDRILTYRIVAQLPEASEAACVLVIDQEEALRLTGILEQK